jgi:hypothetical protein
MLKLQDRAGNIMDFNDDNQLCISIGDRSMIIEYDDQIRLQYALNLNLDRRQHQKEIALEKMHPDRMLVSDFQKRHFKKPKTHLETFTGDLNWVDMTGIGMEDWSTQFYSVPRNYVFAEAIDYE